MIYIESTGNHGDDRDWSVTFNRLKEGDPVRYREHGPMHDYVGTITTGLAGPGSEGYALALAIAARYRNNFLSYLVEYDL